VEDSYAHSLPQISKGRLWPIFLSTTGQVSGIFLATKELSTVWLIAWYKRLHSRYLATNGRFSGPFLATKDFLFM